MNVRMPDGTVIENVPDTMTKAELLKRMKTNGLDYESMIYSPTIGMSTGERFAAGYGAAIPRMARSAGNLVGLVPEEEYREANRLDKPLRTTAGGKAGEFAGAMAPGVAVGMLPGANTTLGAGLYGAGFGLIQPADTLQERIINTATGGFGSAGISMATKRAGGLTLQALGHTLPGRAKNPLVDQAFSSGYKLTPTQAEGGIISRATEGIAGSAKLEKLISAKNAENTNRLIREEFGLPKNTKITPQSLEQIRQPAYNAYESVKTSVKAIKPDKQFRQDLQNLRGDFLSAAKEYPDLIKNEQVEKLIKSMDVQASPRSMVELTRKLRKDASSNFKAFDDPEKQALAQAQRGAADALEELIDRALTSVGKQGLVNDWRQARQLLAKTYDVESALNETTGNVSTRQLAKMLDKGKPLTGNLRTVAQFGRSFDRAARDPDVMRDVSLMDMGDIFTGSAAGIGTGNPLGLAAAGTRPMIRQIMASKAGQSAIKPPRELPLSDIRNLDNLSRAAVPLTMGGLSVYPNE